MIKKILFKTLSFWYLFLLLGIMFYQKGLYLGTKTTIVGLYYLLLIAMFGMFPIAIGFKLGLVDTLKEYRRIIILYLILFCTEAFIWVSFKLIYERDINSFFAEKINMEYYIDLAISYPLIALSAFVFGFAVHAVLKRVS